MTWFLKQIASAALTLFLLSALTFFLIRVAPGGPFDGDKAWPPEIKANIEHSYGLDQPVTLQFAHWLKDVAHGDLRESFQYIGRPVTEMIGESLPASLWLGGCALFIAILLGIPLGSIAAWKRGTWLDSSSMFIAVAGISLPSYLVASLLILYFSLHLMWLPPALWDGWQSMILPIATLALRPLAMIARLTRASMLDTLSSDFIRTAYAKGLSPWKVIFKHALRNSLIPVLTLLGPLAAGLVTGSFVVETVFQIPGMGRFFVEGVLNRDYPLVMGITLVYGAILIASNLVTDLMYGWTDPRVRIQEELAR
jgi:oligopeptide transport system permease protein